VCRGLAELKDERAIPMPLDTTAYGCPPQARSATMRALGKLHARPSSWVRAPTTVSGG
jgi:hypothetical protein